MTTRTATGLIAAYMRLCGFKGRTSFWGVDYTMLGYEHRQPLIRNLLKIFSQFCAVGHLYNTPA